MLLLLMLYQPAIVKSWIDGHHHCRQELSVETLYAPRSGSVCPLSSRFSRVCETRVLPVSSMVTVWVKMICAASMHLCCICAAYELMCIPQSGVLMRPSDSDTGAGKSTILEKYLRKR